MPKALVTGGSGFVGSHVVRRLLAENVEVRCLVRPASNRANLAGLPVDIVTGDLLDPASLRAALQDCEWLFHAAADYRLWSRDPHAMHRVNVEGTRQLFQAAADAKIRKIVFTSSVAAVGRPDTGVGREEWDPTPAQQVSLYKKSKFESDRLAREFAGQGLPIVIVNPSAPIGSRDIRPTPTGKIIVDFLNRRMPAYLATGMNFVDVEDVAAGHWLAAQKGRIGERYILGNKNMTLKEFLESLARLAGLPAPTIRIPYALAWLAGAASTGLSWVTGKEPAVPLDGVRMAHHPMYYDASKAVRELGLPQTPIEEAIRKAIAWFRKKGMSALEPVGIVIPTSWEASVFLSRHYRRAEYLEKLKPSFLPLRCALLEPGLFWMTVGPREVWVKISGVGETAARAAAHRLYGAGARTLVSAGFCGALVPALRVGDLVTDRIAFAASPVRTAQERKALSEQASAVAVDMETRPIIEEGTRRGVPIRIVRVVSDEIDDDLTPLFGSDGKFSAARIALRLLNPTVWPLALRLKRHSAIAKVRLADALEMFLTGKSLDPK